jgi:protein involved in polysaccharide export with SLBB domain
VNLLKYKSSVDRTSKNRALVIMILSALLPIGLGGCGDNVHLPSSKELVEFENAGPIPPSIDTNRMVRAKIGGGPYRVVVGDALELTMPAVVRFITVKEFGSDNTVSPYIARVNENGNIILPIVGDIKASGRTLSQIESDIIEAYFPKHVVTRPSVFARVLDYETSRVSITGAVRVPGIYSLRSDQMSLVALIMEAGGIIDEGAAFIRIIHSNQDISNSEEAGVRTVAQSFNSLNDLNRTLPAKSDTNQIGGNNNNIPPFFRQAISSSAIGALATRQGEKRLRTDQANVESNDQRPLLVYRLAWEEPLVSSAHTETELFSPVKPAGFDHTKSDLGNAAVISVSNRGQRIQRIADINKPRKSESLILPVKGLNIPFADVALEDGDSVIVERLQPPLFSVMGLVNGPGNFPYPPDVQYTLMQAIGFGGGLNLITEPRYATIYRLKRDGTCIHVTFPIKGDAKLANASNTLIKPGDIIAVEHTPRTRTALFLDRTFRFSIGSYWRLNDNGTFD